MEPEGKGDGWDLDARHVARASRATRVARATEPGHGVFLGKPSLEFGMDVEQTCEAHVEKVWVPRGMDRVDGPGGCPRVDGKDPIHASGTRILQLEQVPWSNTTPTRNGRIQNWIGTRPSADLAKTRQPCTTVFELLAQGQSGIPLRKQLLAHHASVRTSDPRRRKGHALPIGDC